MKTVNVTIAYGIPKWAAVVQALAKAIGGTEVCCDVNPSNTQVIVTFTDDQQAKEFRNDLHIFSAIAYAGSDETDEQCDTPDPAT